MYGFPRLEPNYPIKTKLQVETVALLRTENKEEEDDFEEKKSNLLI